MSLSHVLPDAVGVAEEELCVWGNRIDRDALLAAIDALEDDEAVRAFLEHVARRHVDVELRLRIRLDEHAHGSVLSVPDGLAFVRVTHRCEAPELRPEALGLGFVAVHDRVLEQGVRLLDLVDQVVSLWKCHGDIIASSGLGADGRTFCADFSEFGAECDIIVGKEVDES